MKLDRRSGGSPASTCDAAEDRRGASASVSFCLVLALSFALFGCGTKQTLEQAIQCDAFKRSADGTWSASRDVSLDYLRDGTQYQLNFSKGVAVKGKSASQEAQLLPVLERKCKPNR